MIVIRPHKTIESQYPKLKGVEDIQIEIAQTQDEAFKLAEDIWKFKLHNNPHGGSEINRLLRKLKDKRKPFGPEVPYKFRHNGEDVERPACIIAVIYSGYDTIRLTRTKTVEVPIAVGCLVMNYRYTNHYTATAYRRKGYASLLWNAVITAIPAAAVKAYNVTNHSKLKSFFEKNGIQTPEIKRR